MIYLRCSMRTLRKRIKLRGRQMESDIPLSYLKRLESLYEDWLSNYQSCNAEYGEVLVLETDKLDYINDMVDCLEVMERVEALLPGNKGLSSDLKRENCKQQMLHLSSPVLKRWYSKHKAQLRQKEQADTKAH